MDTPILIALLGATASVVVSCLSAYFAYRARLKESELSEQNAERKARRDYEYEARKRLYSECEPLLFELSQLSLGGLKRVGSLARTARDGYLKANGWLSDDGYYTLSTVYKFFAPLAVVKIIQRRITLIDLRLDSRIKRQYILADNLYQTFSSDFKLAGREPVLKYIPDFDRSDAEAVKQARQEPEVYSRQGLPVGRLDNAVENLIVADQKGSLRCMSFGEFERAYQNTSSDLRKNFEPVVNLFLNFHPQTRPVLWRILVTQLHIHKAILDDSELDSDGTQHHQCPTIPKKEILGRYNWRTVTEAVDQKIQEPFDVAEQFLQKRLSKAFSVKPGAEQRTEEES